MKRLGVEEAERGVLAGDRGVLSRAITLVESRREADRDDAEELVTRLLPHTGRAIRVGISGAPGVGKSTFIEALGIKLIEQHGHRVAVLAVDPSSAISGGSILGDKTRMTLLASHPMAFVRPSPAASELGGVARRTREAMLLCEAAGFGVVLVETVGVGQSEAEVASMVDFFMVLLIAGAGDELQGIKRGIIELADAVVINKADGDGVTRAELARREIASALHYLRPRYPGIEPRALCASAVSGTGLDDVWRVVLEHHAHLEGTGELERLRRGQSKRWMWSLIEQRLVELFHADSRVAKKALELERAVESGVQSPERAARELLGLFLEKKT